MKEKEIEDVLADHADALNRDEDVSQQLLAAHADQAHELAPLLQLAAALKAALMPVRAPAFKNKLGQELVSYGPPVITLGQSVSKRKAKVWLALAAAGSLLSAAGVVAFLLRRMRGVKEPAPQTSTAS